MRRSICTGRPQVNEGGAERIARVGWGAGARVGRGVAGAHMCSKGCCCWSANDVWRCRLRKLSLGDLGLVSENTPWRLADLADATLCKSPSLGRVAMVETGLESGCGKVLSAFNLRLASRRVDWRSWVFSSFSLLDRLSRARLWWNMPPHCPPTWSEVRSLWNTPKVSVAIL